MDDRYNLSFFQNIIRVYKCDPSIEIIKVNKEPAIGKGNNFMSYVQRITILGHNVKNGKNKTAFTEHLIAKEIPDNEDYRNFLPCEIAFNNEYSAYQDIIPALNQYSARPLALPKCIFANNTIIVLEDLKPLGFGNVDKLNGLNMDRTINIIKELANLHAASIVMKEQNPSLFEKLASQHEDVLNFNSQVSALEVATALMKERSKDEELEKKLKDFKLGALNKLQSAIQTIRKYSVICHGDLWVNNILFNGDQLKLVDLQNMKHTSPAYDLSYFLYINLKPETRVQHIDFLLKTYLEELNQSTKIKGIDLETDLNITWLRSEMKELSIHGFLSALWIMPVFYIDPELLISSTTFTKDSLLSTDDKVRLVSSEEAKRIFELIKLYFEEFL